MFTFSPHHYIIDDITDIIGSKIAGEFIVKKREWINV